LRLAHLRTDIHLGDEGWQHTLARSLELCESLGVKLELALFLSSDDDLSVLRERISTTEIARVLVAPEGAQTVTPLETTPASLVSYVKRSLELDDVPIAGGTDMYFCELNRTRPQIDAMDGVFWSINPQVHAFDDLSLLETPEAQGAQVQTAHHFAAGKPLFVGPITLRRRYNVNAADSTRRPEAPDDRQDSQINAAWTAASLKHLSDHGVDAATYFEICGPAGVLAEGQPLPVYEALSALCGLRGESVLECISTSPLQVCGLAARVGTSTTLIAINLTAATQTVEVEAAGIQRSLELSPYGLFKVDLEEGVAQ
jgi:hypothetical protein